MPLPDSWIDMGSSAIAAHHVIVRHHQAPMNLNRDILGRYCPSIWLRRDEPMTMIPRMFPKRASTAFVSLKSKAIAAKIDTPSERLARLSQAARVDTIYIYIYKPEAPSQKS